MHQRADRPHRDQVLAVLRLRHLKPILGHAVLSRYSAGPHCPRGANPSPPEAILDLVRDEAFAMRGQVADQRRASGWKPNNASDDATYIYPRTRAAMTSARRNRRS